MSDMLSRHNLEHLGTKTGHDAVKALVYLDELLQFPLARENTADTERMTEIEEKYGITRAMIVEQQEALDKQVAQRFAYIQKKLWTTRKNGQEYVRIDQQITDEDISKNQWVKRLQQLLIESQYHILQPENFSSPDQTAQHIKQIKGDLEASPTRYTELESMRNQNRKNILYYYQASQYFIEHMREFGQEEEYPAKILEQVDYLENFVLYKCLTEWVNMRQAVMAIDPTTIDYVAIRAFLLNTWPTSATIDIQDETLEHMTMLSSAEVIHQYNVSSNTMQNILYRIATEILGYNIENNMDTIYMAFHESNQDTHGIYFARNNEQIRVNNRRRVPIINPILPFIKVWEIPLSIFWSDYRHNMNDLLANAEKIREFRDQVKSATGDGDFIQVWSGSRIINKELQQKYIAIIDEELWYIEHADEHMKNIFTYIQQHARHGYIQLPVEHVLTAVRIWHADAGEYLYHYDGSNIVLFHTQTKEKTLIPQPNHLA